VLGLGRGTSRGHVRAPWCASCDPRADVRGLGVAGHGSRAVVGAPWSVRRASLGAHGASNAMPSRRVARELRPLELTSAGSASLAMGRVLWLARLGPSAARSSSRVEHPPPAGCGARPAPREPSSRARRCGPWVASGDARTEVCFTASRDRWAVCRKSGARRPRAETRAARRRAAVRGVEGDPRGQRLCSRP
jgi:hypothetical protein